MMPREEKHLIYPTARMGIDHAFIVRKIEIIDKI